MLAPNPSSSYNDRPGFKNPKYLKKAQYEKLCLYKVSYDKDDFANIFAPNCEETLILVQESRSKLDKEKIKKKFAELVRHCISLELSLKQRNKVFQNNRPCQNQDAPEFPEFFEINELKAQIQDKNTVINELKKLIEKLKGKSVDTKLSHLNFNLLSKKDIVNGLPKLKYVKDQLCLSCEMGKAKRSTFKKKVVPSSKGWLNLLHMDLRGPMRIESINGKNTFCDRGTEFLNNTLHAYFKEEGIEHQTSIARTPQQNGFVKIWNRTLVETARTMLSASKPSLFFWAEAISKGYRVYNKRTKLIIESIHINFDELKEISITSDYDNSGPVPQLEKTFVHNSTELGIQDHNNEPSSLTLVPNVVPPTDMTDTSLQELDLLFSPMYKEYFTAGNLSVSKSSALSDNL
ncbi:retrovirus-related pol polyprotein from transposon TNT 1-94 [Tanacetum coccineum]